MVAVEDVVEILGRERDVQVDEQLPDLLLERHLVDGAPHPGDGCGIQVERLRGQIDHLAPSPRQGARSPLAIIVSARLRRARSPVRMPMPWPSWSRPRTQIACTA